MAVLRLMYLSNSIKVCLIYSTSVLINKKELLDILPEFFVSVWNSLSQVTLLEIYHSGNILLLVAFLIGNHAHVLYNFKFCVNENFW